MRYPSSETINDAKTIIAEQLISMYARSSYFDLEKAYCSFIDHSAAPEHLALTYKEYRSEQSTRGERFTNMFLSRLVDYFDLPDKAEALEIGCGSGASLLPLSRIYSHVVGIDLNLAALLIASKFCEENNVTNVQLIRAYGQYLPFDANTFAYVTAQNVLEHVFEIEDVIAEVRRILKPNGCFAADSRNRYDLFFPEPHVKLRWIGLLPRTWANSYVRWRIGMNYDDTHTRLLSYWDLKKALAQSFGNNWQIVIPQIDAYGKHEKLDAILTVIERTSWLRRLLVLIFPSHLALAQKRAMD